MLSSFVGMVGIGAMGRPIARRVAERYPLNIYSRHEDIREEMRMLGASPAHSISDLAKSSSLIYLCVRDYVQCDQVTRELLGAGFQGSVVLLSTVGADEARRLSLLCSKADCSLLALPISGGVDGAESGDLTGYFAGHSSLRREALAVAGCFCKTVFDLGADVAVPFALKAVVQFLVASSMMATSEAASMINRLGLNEEVCYNAICSSSGASNIFVKRGKEAMRHNFSTGRSGVGIHLKDLHLCTEMLGDAAEKYPLLSLCLNRFAESDKVFDSKLDATVMTLLSDGDYVVGAGNQP